MANTAEVDAAGVLCDVFTPFVLSVKFSFYAVIRAYLFLILLYNPLNEKVLTSDDFLVSPPSGSLPCTTAEYKIKKINKIIRLCVAN